LKRLSSAARDSAALSKEEWAQAIHEAQQQLSSSAQDAASAAAAQKAQAAGIEVAERVAVKMLLGDMAQQYAKHMSHALRPPDRPQSAQAAHVGLGMAMLAAASGLEKLRRVGEVVEGKVFLALDGGALPSAMWPRSSRRGRAASAGTDMVCALLRCAWRAPLPLPPRVASAVEDDADVRRRRLLGASREKPWRCSMMLRGRSMIR
jgi:predicted component of type VI protein secretion system